MRKTACRDALLSTACAAACVVFTSASAYAQDDDAVVDESDVIIVSAERREQSLQEAPAVVNVVSDLQLETQRAKSLEDVTAFIPGLKIDGNGRDQLRLGLRGAFSSVDNPGSGQSVGIYIDGAYIGRTADLAPVLFDLQQVEVVRGPQGTLYGRNAVGGLINIITKDPTDEVEGILSASYGKYGRLDLAARVSGPIFDNLYGLVSITSSDSDGWTQNLVTGNRLGREDTKGIRTKLLWEASDRATAKLTVAYFVDKTQGVPRFVAVGDPSRYTVPSLEVGTNLVEDGGYDRESVSGVLDLAYDFGGAELTSISTYHKLDSVYDAQPIFVDPESLGVIDRENDTESYSQELRLAGETGRLNWQFGGNIYKDNSIRRENYRLEFASGTLFPLSPETSNPQMERVHSRSLAGFAQGTYALTDWLNVTGGVRYTADKKDSTWTNTGFIFPPLGLLAEPDFTVMQDASWDQVTYKGTIDAYWNDVGPFDSLLLYATISKGYKEGTFVNGATAASSTTIDPEKARNYEGGFKTTFADGRVAFNASYFHVDYTALQSLSQVGSGAVTIASTDATANGIESDLSVELFDGFDVAVGYAYLDATLDQGATAPNGSDVSGNVMPQSPKHSVNASFNYLTAVSDSTDFRLGAQYSYKGGVFYDVRNNRSDNPVVFNRSKQSLLSFEAALLRGNWEFALWGKNMLDDKAFLRVFNASGAPMIFTPADIGEDYQDGILLERRTYGGTVRFRF